eukprot:31194-Pelagococcus_subviridis.AAC.5
MSIAREERDVRSGAVIPAADFPRANRRLRAEAIRRGNGRETEEHEGEEHSSSAVLEPRERERRVEVDDAEQKRRERRHEQVREKQRRVPGRRLVHARPSPEFLDGRLRRHRGRRRRERSRLTLAVEEPMRLDDDDVEAEAGRRRRGRRNRRRERPVLVDVGVFFLAGPPRRRPERRGGREELHAHGRARRDLEHPLADVDAVRPPRGVGRCLPAAVVKNSFPVSVRRRRRRDVARRRRREVFDRAREPNRGELRLRDRGRALPQHDAADAEEHDLIHHAKRPRRRLVHAEDDDPAEVAVASRRGRQRAQSEHHARRRARVEAARGLV